MLISLCPRGISRDVACQQRVIRRDVGRRHRRDDSAAAIRDVVRIAHDRADIEPAALIHRSLEISETHQRRCKEITKPMRRQLSQQGMSLLAAAQCRRAVRPSPRRRSSTASVSVARRNAAIVRLTIPLKAVFV